MNPKLEYLQNWRTYYREEMTITKLEEELKKRKIRRAKALTSVEKISGLQGTALTDAKSRLKDKMRKVKDAVATQMNARWGIGDKSWMGESLEPANVIFDSDLHEGPNVVMDYPGDAHCSIIINVVDSVKRDFRNISNPCIVAAIERYVACLDLSATKKQDQSVVDTDSDKDYARLFGPASSEAEEVLNKICQALKAGLRSRARQRLTHQNQIEIYMDWKTSEFEDDYFERLSKILKDKDVKRYEKLKTNWKSQIRLRLQECMKDIDHKRVLDFLGAAPLPRAKTPAALRNAFFAWCNDIDTRTFAKYKSQALKSFRERRKKLRSRYLATDLDEATDFAFDGFLLKMGIGKVETYDDLRSSNLVWDVVKRSDERISANHVKEKNGRV